MIGQAVTNRRAEYSQLCAALGIFFVGALVYLFDRSGAHRGSIMMPFKVHFLFVLFLLAPVPGSSATLTLLAGTTLYAELGEAVSSKKHENEVGDIVRARVWRNVKIDGQVAIAAGAPMILRVSKVKRRKIAGIKGQIELEAVSTRAVDGTTVLLDGGYDKKGKQRTALAASLSALVVWPAIFIAGSHAELPVGTIIDAGVQADTRIATASDRLPFLNFAGLSNLSVEILYEQLDEKGKSLPLQITLCEQVWADPYVVTVNGDEITPMEIEVGATEQQDDCIEGSGSVSLRQLSKHFAKGINRFEIQLGEDSTEVLLDVEM